MSVGEASPQSKLENSVRASLERADKEIKTALKKLVGATVPHSTLPPSAETEADHLGVLEAAPSDHSDQETRPPVIVHEAGTQTQRAGGHGRSEVRLENFPWISRETKMLHVTKMKLFPARCFFVF